MRGRMGIKPKRGNKNHVNSGSHTDDETCPRVIRYRCNVCCVLFKFSLIHSFCFLIHHFLVVHSNGHCAAVLLLCCGMHTGERSKKKRTSDGQMMKNDYLIWLLFCARRLHLINQHLINVDDDVNINIRSEFFFLPMTWHWKGEK